MASLQTRTLHATDASETTQHGSITPGRHPKKTRTEFSPTETSSKNRSKWPACRMVCPSSKSAWLGNPNEKLLENGHEVHAIEIDKTLFANLEKSLESFVKTKLTLTHGDAVKLPLASLPRSMTTRLWPTCPMPSLRPGLNLSLPPETPRTNGFNASAEAIERMWAECRSKLQRPFHLSARCLPTPNLTRFRGDAFIPCPRWTRFLQDGSSNRPFLFSAPTEP